VEASAHARSTYCREGLKFLLRSRFVLNSQAGYWWQQQQHIARIHAGIPDLNLLQQNVIPAPATSVAPVSAVSAGRIVDRLVTDQVSTSCFVTARHSLAATLLGDALRAIPRTADRRFASFSDADWDTIISPYTLPNLQSHVFMLALCSPISTVLRYTICKILSKTIVQRCMTRKFGSVCLTDFRVEKNRDGHTVYNGTDVMVQIRQLILCSFLGNYSHCEAASRPMGEVRDFLYSRMFNPLLIDVDIVDWFYKFFKQCSHVIVFALRDYLVFAIRDDPSMHEHFSSLINFDNGQDSFAAVTTAAMNAVRQFLSQNMGLLQSSDTSPQLFIQLNSLIAPFHERILKLSYKRMNASILPNLVAARKDLPMKQIPGVVVPSALKEEEEVVEDDILGLDLNVGGASISLGDLLEEDSEAVIEPVFDIQSYISDVQLDALTHLVRRVVHLPNGGLMRCISFFIFFGSDVNSVRYLYRVLKDIHEGNVSHKEELMLFKKLFKKDPHTYTLLQVTAELIKEAQSIGIAATLPLHYWYNQLDAARSRFGLEQTTYVVTNTMYFCFCTVCDTVYSLVSEFQSVYKQQYLFGLRSAVVGSKHTYTPCHAASLNTECLLHALAVTRTKIHTSAPCVI
jgi:hypothetical protein